jgi:hypothetical protein
MPRSQRPFLVGIVLSLTLLVSACSSGTSQDVGQGPVPDDVVTLIDQWKQATDSSIVDLYTNTGYHLYGDEQFAGDDLATHLTSPSALNVGHEELTPLLLLVDEPGRWVVTQGVENTFGTVKDRSGVSWEIVEVSSGDLKIAQSAWFYATGSQ